VIRCIRFRPYQKNTLVGFADLHLVRTGIIIRDCCLHEKNDKRWISFPARSYQDKYGHTLWSPVIEFAEDATAAREQFQQQAVAAAVAAADKTGEAA
jgi:hypothetical protein